MWGQGVTIKDELFQSDFTEQIEGIKTEANSSVSSINGSNEKVDEIIPEVLIVSHLFWPSLRDETLKFPPQLQRYFALFSMLTICEI